VSLSLLSMSVQWSSVSLEATDAVVARMRDEADPVWCPELARLIRETARPFVDVIYDADPLPALSWGAWPGGTWSGSRALFRSTRRRRVLHARRLGRIKQGQPVDGKPDGFDVRMATEDRNCPLAHSLKWAKISPADASALNSPFYQSSSFSPPGLFLFFLKKIKEMLMFLSSSSHNLLSSVIGASPPAT
jgi:hypothetical protein